MANSLKQKPAAAPNPEKLTPEKETEVSVQEIVQDERTHRMIGAIILVLALFLFVAFTSYLFTWQEDQDKVHQFGIKLFSIDDVKMSNLLGVLGAYVAHFFFFKGFGIASFLLCTSLFVLGVNLFFSKTVFSFWKNIRYVLIGLLLGSVSFSFFAGNNVFPWGGAVGELSTEWLKKWIGGFGTGALISLSALLYVIWRFNPSFKWPEKKMSNDVNHFDNNFQAEDDEEPIKYDWNEKNVELEEEIENENNSQNKLKPGSNLVSVLMPNEEANPLTQLELHDLDANNSKSLSAEKNTSNNKAKEQITLELAAAETVSNKMEISDSKQYEPTLDLRDYKYPGLNLLESHGSEKIVHDPTELEANKNQIIATLRNYDIEIQRISATVGPTVTLYEIVPSPGVRISRIKNLEDDIALSLAALGIRIIAPIPGKGTIGIEVPNVRKTIVSMKTLLSSDKFQNSKFSLPIAIGKKIDNENFIVDLTSMPHLLMAGATGQGKSVGLNAILVSLLYKKHPSQLKFVLVDPKKVELSLYKAIEKHFLAKLPGEEDSIITDTKKVVHTLNALCIEMDNRYDLLKEAGCRNIKEYNEKFVSRKLNPLKGHQFLPFIVLVIDEFADLIMTAGKEIEMPIARLAQLARAVGIHLIIATQRPSVNIITGTIKANFPARIAFKVSSKIDSRTILDTGGAEQLIGKGDMLVSYNGDVTRLQCAFVDTPEVDRVCEFIEKQRGYPEAFLLPEYIDEKELEGKIFDASDRDKLFNDAARLIVSSQMGSTSLIQRRMKLGYNRAGRLMDQLEAAGIVGPSQGSKARDVYIKTDVDLEKLLQGFE